MVSKDFVDMKIRPETCQEHKIHLGDTYKEIKLQY
jgi:hypothetical protein